LAGLGQKIEKKGLDDFNGLVPMDLQESLGHGFDLAFAGLVGPVVAFPVAFDGGDARIDPAGVLLVADGFVEKLPEADDVRALVFDQEFQGLVHEMDGASGGGQLVRDRLENFDGRFVEGEKMGEFGLADAVRPAEAPLVEKVVLVDGGGVLDFPDPRQDDVVIVLVVFEKLDQLETVVREDVLDAHLALQSLLGGADGPNGKALDFGQAVGQHHQGLFVVASLVVVPVLHEQGNFVENEQEAAIAFPEDGFDQVP
jgi:hypothetical protein